MLRNDPEIQLNTAEVREYKTMYTDKDHIY